MKDAALDAEPVGPALRRAVLPARVDGLRDGAIRGNPEVSGKVRRVEGGGEAMRFGTCLPRFLPSWPSLMCRTSPRGCEVIARGLLMVKRFPYQVVKGILAISRSP